MESLRSVKNSDATTVLPPPDYEVCDGNPLAEGMSGLDDILRAQSPGAGTLQMSSTGNEVEVQPEDGNPAYSNDSDVGVEMVSLSPRAAPDSEVHSVFSDDAGNAQGGSDGPPTYTAIQSRPRRLNLMGSSAPKELPILLVATIPCHVPHYLLNFSLHNHTKHT